MILIKQLFHNSKNIAVLRICFSMLLVNTLLCGYVHALESSADDTVKSEQDKIFRFGPGVHVIDRIVLMQPHSLVEGAGTGVTILKMKNGIQAFSANPIIRNMTIVGAGNGIGLHLMNTWSARIIDVEIENYAIGLKLELSVKGREAANGKTLNHWPGALTESDWGSRISLTDIRGVEITGPGDGVVLENKLKSSSSGKKYWKPTDDKRPGEFINATTLWGGHIAVKGRGLVIGNGVFKTQLVGTYMDISPNGGIVMEEGARGLTLIGVSLDLNYAARESNVHRITAPSREAKSIQMYGTNPKDIKVLKKH